MNQAPTPPPFDAQSMPLPQQPADMNLPVPVEQSSWHVPLELPGINERHQQEWAESTYGRIASVAPEELHPVIEEAIFLGQHQGESIDVPGEIVPSRSSHEDLSNRAMFARLAVRAPEEATLYAHDHVAGLHGTRSIALAGILKDGALGSGEHLREQEAMVFTGEQVLQGAEGQRGISFSRLDGIRNGAFTFAGYNQRPVTIEDLRRQQDKEYESLKEAHYKPRIMDALRAHTADRERVLTYLEQNPDSLEAQLATQSFPVLVAVSQEGIVQAEKDVPSSLRHVEDTGVLLGTSGMSEFRVLAKKIDKTGIPLIAVPADKVDFVRELCRQYHFENTRVTAIEPYIEIAEHFETMPPQLDSA